MRKMKFELLITSILVFPITCLIFHFLPYYLSGLITFVVSMGIYLLFLSLSILYITQGKLRYLTSIIKTTQEEKKNTIFKIIPFLPVFGVFLISFVPNVLQITPISLMIVIIIAVINGTIEEIYWRGLYLKEFRHSPFIGLFISPLLFAMWHISLWFLRGITYHGGFLALVGGAFAMGLLWSFSSRQLKSIHLCIYAHILVNIFAFTGLFVENGF